jgi:hypothetical protein
MTSCAGIYLSLKPGRIRLLALRAGEVDDEIRCDFHTASLDRNSQYEALSSVWGDAALTNFRLCGNTTSIKVNLEAALRHIRLEDKYRTLWVDAVIFSLRLSVWHSWFGIMGEPVRQHLKY